MAIATREAILGDDLATLEAVVRGRLAPRRRTNAQARAHAEQLRIQAIRQIIGYLRPRAADGGGGRA